MDHSVFLASYVAHLAEREARDPVRREEKYFREQAEYDAGDLIRRLIVAAAIISVSFSSLIVTAGYAGPDMREASVLVS